MTTTDPLTRALPGLLGAHHAAYTVPDLDEAVEFFTGVIGATEVYRAGPVEDDGDWMARHLNVHPRARAMVAVVRLPDGLELELFEYEAPDQRRIQPANSDWGGHHLALRVADVDAAAAYLRARGVRVLADPQTIHAAHPVAGTRWVYVLTPWGMHLELYAPGPSRAPDDAVPGAGAGAGALDQGRA
ncbi:VOC family protein [Kitasatospora sp. NPDC002965]|uniref:VOC family protein n=1 Tax=Kitasatospora sp. NPDC002965 TaxID=3154775 RepID=UPI00339E1ED9